jgi:hypothetical protein
LTYQKFKDALQAAIKFKKFLTAEAIPTVDDFEAACKTFPEKESTNVPSAPNVPEHSADIRAKRRLLRDVHSPSLIREMHFKTMKCLLEKTKNRLPEKPRKSGCSIMQLIGNVNVSSDLNICSVYFVTTLKF